MKTVFCDKHALHSPQVEIDGGQIVECADTPERLESVLQAIADRKVGQIISPASHSIEKILRVHDRGYVDFLKTAYQEWVDAGFEGNAFGTNFNYNKGKVKPPKSIIGKLGYYLSDTSVSITKGTWDAVEQGAHGVLTALDCILAGDRSAFSLSRPAGHHASATMGAGYGFINFAAVAAHAALDRGHSKVAVLDVDYHHGNGTQDIFYQRSDVLYCSLHADPALDFPFFSGYVDETGAGAGEGYNRNYPLPLGTEWPDYRVAMQDALKRIDMFGADLTIVSLGVDTYRHDPISGFGLDQEDYLRMGEDIASLGDSTLFVMEGGYAVDDLGTNIVNVLDGFIGR